MWITNQGQYQTVCLLKTLGRENLFLESCRNQQLLYIKLLISMPFLSSVYSQWLMHLDLPQPINTKNWTDLQGPGLQVVPKREKKNVDRTGILKTKPEVKCKTK